jgi:hypothetical protein
MLEIDDIANVVAGAVREAAAPLLKRINELEQREIVLPEKGEPGVGVVSAEVRTNILEITLTDGTVIEAGDVGPRHGKDADPAMVKAAVDEAVAALPPPEKGDPGVVDMAKVGQQIESAVKSAVEALPAPKDGDPGKDGPGFVDAVLDGSGALVLTRTDGSTKTLPDVKGRDGVGFAEAFDADGQIVLRMTDGSELTIPIPEVPHFCSDDTSEMVAKALRAVAEMPPARVEEPKAEPAQPVVVHVTAGQPQSAAQPTTKSITARRDGNGNLVADIIETIETAPQQITKTLTTRRDGNGNLVAEVA